MMAASEILKQEFIALPELLQLHAQARPEATAVLTEDECLTLSGAAFARGSRGCLFPTGWPASG
jgi:hypothetical protein